MAAPILLVVAALATLVLEVFVVSFGALTLVAIGCAIGGIMLAFQQSPEFGWTLVGIMVAGGPLVIWGAFKILPKLPFGRNILLQGPKLSEAERRAAAPSQTDLLGAVGETVSPLRPAGTAVFDGKPTPVIARGSMVPAGRRVKVVDVTGNRIVVELLES